MFDAFLKGFKVPAKLFWDPSYVDIINAKIILRDLTNQYWWQHSLHRWTLWFLIFWTIAPLIFWWKYFDRARFMEISLFGLLTSIVAGVLDAAGVHMVLWSYPNKLVPFLPAFFPIDYVVIPVVFMVIYQHYRDWKSFLLVSAIVSAVLSMIFDPILVWLNLYQPHSWQYYYSVPVFVVFVAFVKLVVTVIMNRNIKENC